MIRKMFLAALLLSTPALAQNPGGHASPYAGFGSREAAGISPEEAANLRAGRGMGLALPAEMNGYPGPLHALEFADALGLSPAQRTTMTRLVEAMLTETIPLGERVIATERALDAIFVRGDASPAAVDAATRDAAAARGDLRAAHLRVHLVTKDVMTPNQRERYAQLRGYRPARGETGTGSSRPAGAERPHGG